MKRARTFAGRSTIGRLLGFTALAFTLSGSPDVLASEAIWLANCDGCHGASPSGARANAADGSAALFDEIFGNIASMNSFITGLTSGQKTSLGTYIDSIIVTEPFSMGNTAYDTQKTVNLTNKIFMGTTGAAFNVLENSTTLPTKGTATYNTGTPSVTYNPNACASGSDTWTYRARSTTNGAVSSLRTVNITITATPTISSSAMHSGTFGTPISTYTIASSAFPCPSSTTWNATNLPPGVTRGGANGNVLSGTPTAAGTYSVSLSATNAFTTDFHTLTFTVAKASQTLVFPVQAPTPRAFATAAQPIVQVTSQGASGNPVVYNAAAASAGICTVNNAARTFTMLTAGTCTIEANQALGPNHNAAPEVSRSIVITATAPGTPTIGTGTPGPVSATIGFTPNTNNGGQTPVTFTATCTAAGQTTRSNTGSSSPITVSSMTNGVSYNCSVTAANGAGTSAASGTVAVTPSAALAAPVFTSANATTFQVQVAGNFSVTATGNPSPTMTLFSGTLPTGVTFTGGTGSGTLSGTPAAGTAGTYPLVFRASNSSPALTNVNQSFTLTVNRQDQTISFTQPTTPTTFSLTPVPLSASASPSALTVAFTSNTLGVCTISGANAVLVTVGTCTITANQAGNTVYNAAPAVQRSFDINPGTQTITFNTQLVTARTFSPSGNFAINPTATINSNLTIAYSSKTPGVCSVSGTTVTMLSAGLCTIGANQPGNANWNAATEATQGVTINPTVPAAPNIVSGTPGSGSATIAFTPNTNTGGQAISQFTATCTAAGQTTRSNTGAASPITVSSMTDGVAYDCSVTATNATGTSAPSGTVSVTPAVSGEALWQAICSACHGTDPPSGFRFNAAGTTSTVLEYVRSVQPLMQANSNVQDLTTSELAAIAVYIAEQVPRITTYARTNTDKPVTVSSHITLDTVSFQSVEMVTPPSVGTLSAFTGTSATYTPANGFTGEVTFTYRGRRDSPMLVLGDPRTVTIRVEDNSRQVTVTKTGTGMGDVTTQPTGLLCGLTCTDFFQDGKGMTLTANAQFGSIFTGWSGVTCEEGVNTESTCSITPSSDVTVTANFVPESPPPVLDVSTTNVNFGTQVFGTTFPSMPVVVNNTGGPANSIAVSFVGANPGDFGVSYPCTSTIPSSTSCQFDFTFVPTAQGARSATALIMTDDPVNPTFSINLSGNTTAADTTPNAFTFTDVTNVAVGSVQTSNAITVGGINAPAAISVTGAGMYSVGCTASFTASAGTIGNGQTVCVRHAAAPGFAMTVDTVLTIGGVSDTFTSTTVAADTTPNAFTFTDVTGVGLSAVQTSNVITVGGINAAAAISVTGGTYSIGCTGTFTGTASTIANGQTVCVRHTSSASLSTATNTVLTIGGVSDTFTSTTVGPPDTTPNAFSFNDVTGIQPGSVQTSNAVTIGGINAAAAISVTGGTYSIGCTGTFTGSASTITNGQTVCVRHTAPLATSATTNTTLTVGGVSDVFSSTTVVSLPPNGDQDNDGIPNAVETAESRNPFLKDNDVFANPRLFAMQQYRDFLGREGEADGINFYVGLLNAGTADRIAIIESFLLSPEFQNGLPSVTRLYFSFFNRIPDYGGLTFQLAAFRAGTTLDVIAQNFYNSPEFTNTYGALTNDQYINLVYQNVLGRAPDPDGYNFYITRLNNGTLTKGEMMIGFSESQEFQNLTTNESFVIGVYVGLLKRTPEPSGLDFYVDLLDGGTARRDIIPGFFNSLEYHNRFLP